MIKKWDYFWKNYLMNVQADKFWHFIGFLFLTITLHLYQVSNIFVLIIVITLGVGKEFWDWWHGRYFDFKDLMADAIGVFLAYMINGMYINLLT